MEPRSCHTGIEGGEPHVAGLARGLRHTNVAERRHVSDVASAQHLIVCNKGAFGVDAMCGGGAVVVGEEGAEEGCGEVGV